MHIAPFQQACVRQITLAAQLALGELKAEDAPRPRTGIRVAEVKTAQVLKTQVLE